jgi:hypothetical protein
MGVSASSKLGWRVLGKLKGVRTAYFIIISKQLGFFWSNIFDPLPGNLNSK